MASPLVQAVSEAWPSAAIEWAADSHSAEAAGGIPGVAKVVAADGCVPGALKPASVVALAWRLSRRGYELAIVPDRSRVLAWVARAARIPIRAGLDSGGRGRSYNIRVPVDQVVVRHEADLYLDIARAMGLPVRLHRLKWIPSSAERAWAAERFAGLPAAVSMHPGGGVNPGMTLPSKRWPGDRFAAVARALVADGRTVVVLGGPTDASAVSEVVLGAPGSLDWSVGAGGPDTLGRVAAVVERTQLFLGNDSGIAHLATAVDVPAIVVFGPTDPRVYGPLPGTGIAVSPPHPDRAPPAPSTLADASGSDAILQVSVEQVMAAVHQITSTAVPDAG